MDIIAQLRAERHKVVRQLNSLDTAIRALSGLGRSRRRAAPRRTRGRISVRGLANIRAAQKVRWSKARRGRKVVPIARAGKRTMSAAARRKIAASQRARWAKQKASAKGTSTTAAPKRHISAAGRARIRAAARARWAQVKQRKKAA
jgi:hypothetical protein